MLCGCTKGMALKHYTSLILCRCTIVLIYMYISVLIVNVYLTSIPLTHLYACHRPCHAHFYCNFHNAPRECLTASYMHRPPTRIQNEKPQEMSPQR